MLKIYNTLSRSFEEFKPLKNGKVSFYQCGPTVYSHQHIGNIFSAVKGDLIRRALIYVGYDVTYVRNITDVGHLVSDEDEGQDKLEKGAIKEGLNPEEIALKYTDIYHDDLDRLNVLNPNYETIATKYIEEMANMVQDLIDNGYAYSTDKAIYFEVNKFERYNNLNKQNLEQNLSGAGHGTESDQAKKSPYDFAVWFFKVDKHKNALQTWSWEFHGIKQPTKLGFPGWHIECSAMSKSTLGETIDIHMGGIEHISVHHTNEIAQSEAANGKRFVNYWLHHEMLLIDGGKMSKSLGNIHTLEDLEKRGYKSLDYRYFLLQAHYRSKQNFTFEALEAARISRQNMIKEIANYKGRSNKINLKYDKKFKLKLYDDFNIPAALAVAWELLKDDSIEDPIRLSTLISFDDVFALNIDSIFEKIKDLSSNSVLQRQLRDRDEARLKENWDKSDQLRDEIQKEYNLIIEDTKAGQRIIPLDN